MEEFYTKEEVARILDVSVKTVQRRIKSGKLRSVLRDSKTLIPRRDVDAVVSGLNKKLPPSRLEFERLERDFYSLRITVAAMQQTLGMAAPARRRSVGELQMMRQQCLDLLARLEWDKKLMLVVANELHRVREDEISSLYKEYKDQSLMPLVELARRMVARLEVEPEYPGDGLGVIHAKLTAGLNRLYVKVYAATKVTTGLGAVAARKIKVSLDVRPGDTDAYLIKYLESENN
jgi:excisionase family DNA binding protein